MDIKQLRAKLNRGELTRREFVRAAGALGLGSLATGILAGCQVATPPAAPEVAEEEPGPAAKEGEAVVQPAEKKWRAAYSSVGLAATWVARGADTMQFLGDLLGIEVTVFDGELSVEKQRQNTDDIASQDWDFVAIHPLAIEAYVDPINQLIDRGIPVFDLDTKLTEDLSTLDIITFLEPDNIFMGSAVTQALMQAIGGKGKVVHTQGLLTHTGAQGRAEGFHKVVEQYSDVEVVDETPGDWDVNKVRQIWEDLLVKHPDIAGGMFHNDDMALAAYEVVRAAGKEDQIKLVGVDGMPHALRAVMEDKIVATVVNPTGRIHGGAMWIGWHLLTGRDSQDDVPRFIRTDGPVIDKRIAPGILYLSEHFMI